MLKFSWVLPLQWENVKSRHQKRIKFATVKFAKIEFYLFVTKFSLENNLQAVWPKTDAEIDLLLYQCFVLDCATWLGHVSHSRGQLTEPCHPKYMF